MNNDLTPEERQWSDSAGAALRRSETQLDAVLTARLRAARARALAEASARPAPWIAAPGLSWLSGAGVGATLAIGLLAWTLLPKTAVLPEPAGNVNLAGVDALELLTDEQGPDFYENLDLYLWLEESGEVRSSGA